MKVDLALAIVMLALGPCTSGCKSSPPTPSTGAAAIALTANPNPIAGVVCTRCGSQSTDREATTALTIRETGGVAGTVTSIAMTLRESGTNALLAEGSFETAAVTQLAGSARVPANGTLVVPNIGVHYPRESAGRAASLAYTVGVRDDRGNLVTRDLVVPVSST